jgi:hypothetical protein
LSRATVELGRAQLRLPDQPGLYSVTFDDGSAVQKVLSVNPSPKESQLAYTAEPEALKVWQMAHPSETARTGAAATRTQISLAGILQQRFWWWMLLGGLVALLLESLLAEFKAVKRI